MKRNSVPMSMVMTCPWITCKLVLRRKSADPGGNAGMVSYDKSLLTRFISAVAVKFVNGTRAPIARIPASDAYRNLMLEWFAESDLNGTSSSYDHGGRDSIENAAPLPELKTTSKAAVAVLFNEINEVIQTLTRTYGHNTYNQRVGISNPSFITGAQAKLIRSAVRESGLGTQVAFGTSDIFGNLAVKTRSYTTYLDHQTRSQNQKEDTKPKIVLVLEYNAPTLAGSVIRRTNGTEQRVSYFVDSSLGARDSWRLDSNGKFYEERASARIIGLLRDAIDVIQEDTDFDFSHLRVIIQGERAGDGRFRRIAGEALLAFVVTHRDMAHWKSLVNGDLSTELTADEEREAQFNSALGAAHSGKFFIDAPGPEGCVEEVECRELRKLVLLEYQEQSRLRVQEQEL